MRRSFTLAPVLLAFGIIAGTPGVARAHFLGATKFKVPLTAGEAEQIASLALYSDPKGAIRSRIQLPERLFTPGGCSRFLSRLGVRKLALRILAKALRKLSAYDQSYLRAWLLDEDIDFWVAEKEWITGRTPIGIEVAQKQVKYLHQFSAYAPPTQDFLRRVVSALGDFESSQDGPRLRSGVRVVITRVDHLDAMDWGAHQLHYRYFLIVGSELVNHSGILPLGQSAKDPVGDIVWWKAENQLIELIQDSLSELQE